MAQWVMAVSGAVALLFSFAALATTAGTMIFQRRATETATRAYVDENRAWIKINGVTIDSVPTFTERGCEFKLSIFLDNIGSSPAVKVFPRAHPFPVAGDDFTALKANMIKIRADGAKDYTTSNFHVFPRDPVTFTTDVIRLRQHRVEECSNYSRLYDVKVDLYIIVCITYGIIADDKARQVGMPLKITGIDIPNRTVADEIIITRSDEIASWLI